jgi:hypothetical protein
MDDSNLSKAEKCRGKDDHEFTGLRANFFKAPPNGLILPPERPDFARKKKYIQNSFVSNVFSRSLKPPLRVK